MATIGGEPGGRAAIIVEDNAQEPVAAKPEEHTTTIGVGKPEPGRDIFAGAPVKEAPSQHHNPVQQEMEISEEKEISSVGQPTKGEAKTQVQTEEKVVEEKAEEKSVIKDDEPPAPEPETEPVAVVEKPAGPLGEAEAEADKIAHELYPEEAD